MLVLTADEVTGLLDADPDALPDAMRAAFRAISDGTASVPPRVAAWTPLGMLGAMPGYVPGVGLGAKLVTYFRGNHERGLPGHQAVIVLADPEDGRILAMLDGTVITAVRTAVAAAVAADALAAPAPERIAVIGTGAQARAHLAAFGRMYPGVTRAVAGRSVDRAHAVADADEGAVPVASIAEAVREADIVCLCTDSDEPVVEHGWFRTGCHVSSVGSGVEVDAGTVAAASVFVESRAVATQPFPAGSRELAGLDPAAVTEVGEVLLGLRPGRRSADEVTLYKSMGHASEDVAAAALVYQAALQAGAGTTVRL